MLKETKQYLQPNPLSWSELDCFERDPKEWESRYILGLQAPATKAMIRGGDIGKMIATGDLFKENQAYSLKDVEIHRTIVTQAETHIGDRTQWEWEKKLEVPIEGVPTRGYWDGYKDGILLEIKTGWKLWSPLQAQDHGQLSFYYLQALEKGMEIKEVWLLSASTVSGVVILHKLLPTLEQIVAMSQRITEAHRRMLELGLWDKRLSSKERL